MIGSVRRRCYASFDWPDLGQAPGPGAVVLHATASGRAASHLTVVTAAGRHVSPSSRVARPLLQLEALEVWCRPSPAADDVYCGLLARNLDTGKWEVRAGASVAPDWVAQWIVNYLQTGLGL